MATAKNVVKRDPKNPWNIQSAADTSAKRDTHNPWAVRGQEPAQAKLSVSISPARQGRSGERPNPWRILPVNTLEINPVSSDITKNTAAEASSEPHGATVKKKLTIGTEGFEERSVKLTVSSSSTATTLLTMPQKSKGASESRQNQCEMQDTRTNVSEKMTSPQAVSFKRSTAPKLLVASSTTAQGGLKLSTSVFENPWHRKLPAIVLSSVGGKQEERTVINTLSNTKKCLPAARQNDLSSCVSRAVSSVFENGNAELDLHLQKNIKSLAPVEGLVCTVKSASVPCPDVTASMVAVARPQCASQSAMINCSSITLARSQCSEVEKPQSKGTDNQSTNKSKSHKMCISVVASPANTRGQGSLDNGAVLGEPNSKLKLQVHFSVGQQFQLETLVLMHLLLLFNI